MRVIGYIRVSTEDQAREGVSLEAQERKIRSWWELSGEGRELLLFRDEGISGSRMDRPGLEAAIAACGEGGALVVYSLSRLARSTRGTIELAERLERAGCELVSLSEKIDTSSAAGKMVFRLLAVLAEFERDLTSERTSAALAHLRTQGRRYSRFPEAPREVAERIVELRDQGLSLRAVGARLMAEGVRPVGGGSTWHPKVVASTERRARA